MIDVSSLFAAFDLLSSSWQPWLVVFPGLLIGLLFHAIPGLTTSMADIMASSDQTHRTQQRDCTTGCR
jgi:hypothetical protein